MDIINRRCAGLDVHKKTVVACCITSDESGLKQMETRTFGTMTRDLLALSDWLQAQGISQVAMESTGELWKPIYNILEGQFELLVVNAQHMKTVPGRKTDVKDAEWIADLLRHGLLRASFIPPLHQRDLRDLVRGRANLVADRATVVNRLQKVLEWANIKLTSVVTNVVGISARDMLEALVEGQADPKVMAELARGSMRNKRDLLEQALSGHVRDHHRFMITHHLTQIDFLDEQIGSFDRAIGERLEQQSPPPGQPSDTANASGPAPSEDAHLPPLSWAAAVTLLDTIPGVGRRTAEVLTAELGTDMGRFPSEGHLASWAKLSPGNNESAGKRYSGAIGRGSRWLRDVLVQAAQAATKVKHSYLSAFYHRLAGRRGKKRAIIAVAHRILIAAYHMLKKHQPWQDLGATYLDERNKTRTVNRLTRRIQALGYQVTVEASTPATA